MRLELQLNTATKRGSILALGAVVLLGYGTLVVREARAAAWAESTTIEGLQKSIAIQPKNAEAQLTLAKIEAVALQNPEAAIDRLQHAAQLDPNSAAIQMELATAYRLAGNTEAELAAVKRATQLDPTAPSIAWQAANTYIAEGQTDDALKLLRVAAEYDGQLRIPAMTLAFRATQDIDQVLREAMPPVQEARLHLLNFLYESGEKAAAAKTWQAMLDSKQALNINDSFGYTQYLLDNHEGKAADQVWRALPALAPASRDYLPANGNMLSNPSFELEMLSGGLTWHHWNPPGVQLTADGTEVHAGHRSLRFDFTGSPVSEGLEQYVVVKPNTRYRFSGFVRTDGLESASMPRFAVDDAYRGDKTYLLTDAWPASHDWFEQAGEFVTGPETEVVILRVLRRPTEAMIRGTAWIDDLSLREMP